MNNGWLRFPVYLNGVMHFSGYHSGDLPATECIKRMAFVYENIEFCFAEGRMMDGEIYCQLELLAERIRQNEPLSLDQLKDLAGKISLRYGFDQSTTEESMWIRRDELGQAMIWIDRDKIVAESNKMLFG